jgi:thioredoxin-dependent peroxiredoxin
MLYVRRYQGVIRTTFVIDERGFIRAIFRKPKVGEHAEEILTALD